MRLWLTVGLLNWNEFATYTQVGLGILENIIQCMDQSRCLLLVVSENFLLSQWCQFEMHLAQHR